MKKLISFILTVIFMTAAAAAIPASASPFSDVEDGRWSAASVRYALDNGYMKGVGDGKFDPDGTLTRAAAVTVLWRRQGEPEPDADSGFVDVPSDAWYADAVAWAKNAGVTCGVSDEYFDPSRPVTREQLAAMLFRYAEYAPVSVPERADLDAFDDGGEVSGWAGEALGWAVEAELIEGTDEKTLDPLGHATREQFAAIVERYDGSFKLAYNTPVIRSHYTEKPYPLVDDADVYVSPDGDDSAAGTFDSPLATFAGAAAKVREIKAAKTSGDIVVAFKAGNYGPIEAELTAEDGGSPDQRIIYCKYGDGDVVFDNGVTISEDDFLPLDADEAEMFQQRYADKIRKFDLGSMLDEIPDLDNFAMFSDDGFCSLARFPNKYDDGSDQFLPSAETVDTTTLYISNPVMARRFASYPAERIPEIRIYGYIVRGYRKDTFTLESYDAENKMLTVGYGSTDEYDGKLRQEGGIWWRGEGDTGILMFVLNAAYELDHPGEYWIDRSTGTLYVYDPQGSYHVPLSHGEYRLRGFGSDPKYSYSTEPGYCAVYFEDTGYITFRGIDFLNNAGDFFMGYRTSGIEFDRCSFSCCSGKNMMLFVHSLPDLPMALTVRDCEFDLCVGRHVYVCDESNGPDRFTDRTDLLVDNCLFSRANLTYDWQGAVNMDCCSGGTVSHNSFVNCSRYAVSFMRSCDVVVEYNDFDSAMCNSDDGGVTYGAADVLGNSIVRYNFYNTISPGSVGHFSHYCDDGDSGTVMYSNLFYNAGNVCYHGAGRDNVLCDNVMIDGSGAAIGSYTEDIINGRGLVGMAYYRSAEWDVIRGYIETVPGFAEALEARRPGATALRFDFADALEKDFYLAPTTTFSGNLFINDEKETVLRFVNNSLHYCTVEGNKAYSKNENPVFVNPTLGDYRIRDGADFPDLHFEDIGRY